MSIDLGKKKQQINKNQAENKRFRFVDTTI